MLNNPRYILLGCTLLANAAAAARQFCDLGTNQTLKDNCLGAFNFGTRLYYNYASANGDGFPNYNQSTANSPCDNIPTGSDRTVCYWQQSMGAEKGQAYAEGYQMGAQACDSGPSAGTLAGAALGFTALGMSLYAAGTCLWNRVRHTSDHNTGERTPLNLLQS